MKCTACSKETSHESLFCTWCASYVPNGSVGIKANVFRRFIAFSIDPFIPVVGILLAFLVFFKISPTLAFLVGGLLPTVYAVWFISKLRQGFTPGKMVMSLQVVDARTGGSPGFGRMFLREVIGRLISCLFFGLGNLWALFDRNGQAWHDKMAGTIVVHKLPVKDASALSSSISKSRAA